jgi:hypothetical protein
VSKSRLQRQIEHKIESEMKRADHSHGMAVEPEPSLISASREPDAMWAGRPVYRCQFCGYERVDNLGAVLEHEVGHGPQVRPSPILGADGEPILVEEES